VAETSIAPGPKKNLQGRFCVDIANGLRDNKILGKVIAITKYREGQTSYLLDEGRNEGFCI